MNNATPGPWSTEVLGDTLRIIDSEGNDLILVGDCRNEAKQANAKLMAAGPELLEALWEAREMLGVFEDNGGHDGMMGKAYIVCLNRIDEAIEKATT